MRKEFHCANNEATRWLLVALLLASSSVIISAAANVPKRLSFASVDASCCRDVEPVSLGMWREWWQQPNNNANGTHNANACQSDKYMVSDWPGCGNRFAAGRWRCDAYAWVPKSPSTAAVTSANFLVIVDHQHKALEVRFEDGVESLRSLESTLKSAPYPLNVPGELRLRLAVGVRVACDAQQVCAGLVQYPSDVTMKK